MRLSSSPGTAIRKDISKVFSNNTNNNSKVTLSTNRPHTWVGGITFQPKRKASTQGRNKPNPRKSNKERTTIERLMEELLFSRECGT